MNIFKRYKQMEIYYSEIRIINKCTSDIKDLMHETSIITNKLLDIEKKLSNVDKNDESMKAALLINYETEEKELESIVEKAINYGISRFGLWLRRKRNDKTIIYISHFCRKNIDYLLKKQEKITKKIKSWF